MEVELKIFDATKGKQLGLAIVTTELAEYYFNIYQGYKGPAAAPASIRLDEKVYVPTFKFKDEKINEKMVQAVMEAYNKKMIGDDPANEIPF